MPQVIRNQLKSFTAAGTLPVKLIQGQELVTQVRTGKIPPIHVQLNLTNRCNLNCGFCSCTKRDRQAELSLEQVFMAMSRFRSLGCKAVTITGGGEPLLHPDINFIMKMIAYDLDIKIGLVTNGTKLHNLSVHDAITWCRISSSDDREPKWDVIRAAVLLGPRIDWAFSHVLTRTPNWERLGQLVEFANVHGFTHVRIVADLLDLGLSAANVQAAREYLTESGIDDHLVIYQDRAAYAHGRTNCGISLLKPVLGADGGIYPCCGVQYAQDPPGRDLVPSMRMGGLDDIGCIWQDQAVFNGSVCSRCYYDGYNLALELLASKLDHEEFV